MIPDARSCYRALAARDRRFDGRFFVGVSSTGIYCRPVCPVRRPKFEHCRFFPSAAAAEVSGYRPCLRCRPELAPGQARVDASFRLATAAAEWIDEGFLSEAGLEALAARLGITGRHLRRVFHEAFGVTPVEYAQTHRLLLAKQLLSDTALPVLDVAMAAGFGSLRRFNALFHSRYGMPPSRLRGAGPVREDSVLFHLGFRPPLDWPGLLAFLEKRTIPGVESVAGGVYRRTVSISHGGRRLEGTVEVALAREPARLAVRMSAALLPGCAKVLERVKRLFDLAADPAQIAAVLGPLAKAVPGVRVPGCFDGFEMAVRAILGQQISVAAARTLAGRFARRFGRPAATPDAALGLFFPDAEAIARAPAGEIAALGLPLRRAEAISGLANAVAEKRLLLHPGEPVGRALAALRQLPGIGEWTAQYLAMRALAWPDAFPDGDLGVRKALGETRRARVLERAEAWRPWRAYAVFCLWQTLS